MGSTGLPGSVGSAGMCLPAGIGSLDGAMHGAGPDGGAIDRAMLLELALAAMDELVKVAQMDDPLWLPSLDGGFETLNYDEFRQNRSTAASSGLLL
ncbi:hypothetical protein GUJ93_ZPchr0025g2897 [Zizania palustris]|uniref:START domain-containing protein n=1 Tax=Zizania palustris TaxID=103762 RepID=A0A8J5R4X8_ZIZPA|nr:hypothetical protein GUJ93_ZPchr0025g2897 [Zizania palustris]